MQLTLVLITVLCSILLIGVVLIQKSKGGGLASNFAGANQVLGVRRASNGVEKMTWILASIICVCSLISGILLSHTTDEGVHAKAKPAQEQAVEFPTSTVPAVETPAAADEAVAADAETAIPEAAPVQE